ncbi:MAG: hypothetical protein DRI57_10190 [Deltaproteobacteria bacterium]|nr:MAG: hypothetical protein DRI57_10190 [Deltaproteobacteria bacterium]
MTLAGHVKSAFRLPGGGSCIYKVVYYESVFPKKTKTGKDESDTFCISREVFLASLLPIAKIWSLRGFGTWR